MAVIITQLFITDREIIHAGNRPWWQWHSTFSKYASRSVLITQAQRKPLLSAGTLSVFLTSDKLLHCTNSCCGIAAVNSGLDFIKVCREGQLNEDGHWNIAGLVVRLELMKRHRSFCIGRRGILHRWQGERMRERGRPDMGSRWPPIIGMPGWSASAKWEPLGKFWIIYSSAEAVRIKILALRPLRGD